MPQWAGPLSMHVSECMGEAGGGTLGKNENPGKKPRESQNCDAGR